MTGRPLIDLTGQRFGRLTVLRRSGSTPAGNARWLCRCDCGIETCPSGATLRAGESMSCGCAAAEAVGNANRRHGMHNTPTYHSWRSMHKRCNDPKRKWHHGKGITVCESWMFFSNFLNDMGVRPLGTTLDRWPNREGNYEPGNCRWATAKQQHRNKSNNRLVEFRSEQLCVGEWSERTGLSSAVILYRLKKGWPVERVLTAPINAKHLAARGK